MILSAPFHYLFEGNRPSEYDFTQFIASGGLTSSGILSGVVGTPHLNSGLITRSERTLYGSGTVAEPAIVFAGYPQTGWFLASPNNWSFAVVGTEVFRFTAFGNSIIVSPDLSMLLLSQRQTTGSGEYLHLQVGYSVSGGIFVDLTGEVRLATLSGQGNRTASGQFPISGFPRGE